MTPDRRRVPPLDPSRIATLQDDADACLRLLITQQDQWGPEMVIAPSTNGRHAYLVPVALVGVEPDGALVLPHRPTVGG